MSTQDKPVLVVEKLKKYFPVSHRKNQFIHAVDDVSFTINKGETLGLVGESGCGKSSIARTVTRIYSPDSGKILLGGDDISTLPESKLRPYRKRMQMIFQDPYASLNGRMTVGDIVEEPLRAHPTVHGDQRRAMVEQMLERVGLERDHTGRYPHEFSGGQRQRICIARALVLRPELVICDEAISALDVSIQAQIVNMLADFQKEMGLSYLFIAHDISMVRYISDRIGVMYLGKMVEMCTSSQIYEKPLHPYTQALIAAVPVPDPEIAAQKEIEILEGDIPSPINPPPGCRFCARCKYAMPICKNTDPIYKMVEDNRFVACHLYGSDKM